jgi:hypothetical protein
MTTWNFGDSVTVFISLSFWYDDMLFDGLCQPHGLKLFQTAHRFRSSGGWFPIAPDFILHSSFKIPRAAFSTCGRPKSKFNFLRGHNNLEVEGCGSQAWCRGGQPNLPGGRCGLENSDTLALAGVAHIRLKGLVARVVAGINGSNSARAG